MKLPLTISDNQKNLLNGKYSIVDLIDEYLARINKYDKNINSVLTLNQDNAYKKAKILQKGIAESKSEIIKKLPLLGTVVMHKDLFLTKGIKTTAASKVLESYLPPYSATIVDRMENLGAITLGKTNCDAWAHGASGENSDFDVTKNPWNTQFVPGGSSSGSAASVASGFCLMATGTDTGGSVRQPASFCNLVGLKPTYGVISRYGVIAMSSSVDTVGIMSNSFDDTKIAFDAIKGIDNKDATITKFPSIDKPLNKKIRLGIPREFMGSGLDSEVEKMLSKAIAIFQKAGIEIKYINLPNSKYAISVYYIIQPAEVSSNLGRYDGIRYANDRSYFGDEAKRRIMLGTYVLSSGYFDKYYLKATKVRTKIIEDYDKAFSEVDMIISPVSPTPPFKVGEKSKDPLQMYLADIYTVSANLAGIPAVSVPFLLGKQNLPLGFQLIGPKYSEYELLNMGKYFNELIGWMPKLAF